MLLVSGKGVRVGRDHAVQHADDAGRIGLRQLGVVGDHDYQFFLGNLFEQFHHLHARFGIQRTRRLIGQNNIGIVNQRTGNGHTLHLPARHFTRFLFQLIAQTHRNQRLGGTGTALARLNARQR